MKKILCVFEPFDLTQTIYTIEDKDILNTIKINGIDDISNTILSIAEENDIQEVSLKGQGPISYIEGIKNNIQKEELLKYNKNKLNIHII